MNTSTHAPEEQVQPTELEQLRKENEELRARQSSNKNDLVGHWVKEILGDKFDFSVLGFGDQQVVEVYVPEEMASEESKFNYTVEMPKDGEKVKDGRLRFPKGHIKEGEFCGDVRTCRIQSEEQVKNWLGLVKANIAKTFEKAHKQSPFK